MANISYWTLETALELIRNLEPIAKKTGFSVALAGSVLHAGCSSNDLDLVIFPLNAENYSIDMFRAALPPSWVRKAKPHVVAINWYKSCQSTDAKHVEVWSTPRGRVDLFYLK